MRGPKKKKTYHEKADEIEGRYRKRKSERIRHSFGKDISHDKAKAEKNPEKEKSQNRSKGSLH